MANANHTTSYKPGAVWNAGGGTQSGVSKQFYPADPSCQPCPDCGGLECLCRPRFFAGQLLTEQDLNRLDYYITAKNRLHNRYLWGSGVVCGLEVRCHPCGDAVTVSPGYALSPCGDDIVVCKTDLVDVCKLISKCRTTTTPDCSPFSGSSSACEDMTEPWILAIRYEEKPSRGITALTGASQGTCACGKSNCTSMTVGGCGCAGMPQQSSSAGMSGATQGSVTQSTTTQSSRTAPPACEPTLTCEGYRYEVYPASVANNNFKNTRWSSGWAALATAFDGEMTQRLACCLQTLFASWPKAPPIEIGPAGVPIYTQAFYQWGCAVKQAAIAYFAQNGGYDCATIYQLQAIVIPDPNTASFNDFITAILPLLVIVIGEMIGCFCSSALPPCPGPGDPRVALALVNVRTSDCTVVSVCDWTLERKHVLTFPNMAYWWGWIPYTDLIRQLMSFLCCDFLGLIDLLLGTLEGGSKTMKAPASAADTSAVKDEALVKDPPANPLSQPIAFNVGNYKPNNPAGNVALALASNLQNEPSTVTLGDLFDSVFRPVTVGTGADGVQAEEVASLAVTPAMKTFTEMLRPVTDSIPEGLLQAIINTSTMATRKAQAAPKPSAPPAAPAPAAGAAAPAQPAADLGDLRTQLTVLQQTVAAQQAEIDALKNRPSGAT